MPSPTPAAGLAGNTPGGGAGREKEPAHCCHCPWLSLVLYRAWPEQAGAAALEPSLPPPLGQPEITAAVGAGKGRESAAKQAGDKEEEEFLPAALTSLSTERQMHFCHSTPSGSAPAVHVG